jgi:hypothetical protein
MKISIGQIYIRPGVSFPFSHHMQRWLGEELSRIVNETDVFQKAYGVGFELMVRVSADVGSVSNRIKGPTIFKKTKDVEYTVFLPFDAIVASASGSRCAAVEFLVEGIRSVLQRSGLDVTGLDQKKASIVEYICSEPTMLKEPWPWGQGERI